jgi:hypothetical protein
MSKEAKFKLEELKVESFLTELDEKKEEQIKGGCYKTDPRSGCPVSLGCTVSDNPIACCATTPVCTETTNPIVC